MGYSRVESTGGLQPGAIFGVVGLSLLVAGAVFGDLGLVTN